jgi:hypothetical protein
MQTLLMMLRSADPAMIGDDGMVLVDRGSGPDYYSKNEMLTLLRSRFPHWADSLEAKGIVDVSAQTPDSFETFDQALLKIPRKSLH